MTVDVDALPPTQYLILEVLAVRWRTGEHRWTFPVRLRQHMRSLAAAGLIDWEGGVAPKTVQAWLTDAGRAVVLHDTYQPPVEQRSEPAAGPDLRHLAVILEMGRRAAEQMQDPALIHVLTWMAETAAALHTNSSPFNLDRDFAELA